VRYIAIAIALFLLILIGVQLSWGKSALSRCNKYTPLVRKYHYYYFGVDFPYWFSVGQLYVESGCRHRISSADGIGSYGLAQITWKFWKDRLTKEGIKEIRSVEGNLRAQAYINYDAWKKTPKWCKKLWVTYQIYNGGLWVVKELKKAGKCDWCLAYKECRRRPICFKLKSGKKKCISACEINYEYSVKVWKYGRRFRLVGDKTGKRGHSRFPFW